MSFPWIRAARPLVGDSEALRAVRRTVAQVGRSAAPVLVTGPSGSGKELVARAVHQASGRAGSFIAVNCGAIPRELIESELFGHEKGAFSGAIAQRRGQFEAADSGTLFLDEIGDMPLDLQVKLLRILEEGALRRVGGNGLTPIDVRIISATNCDLGRLIVKGMFREDLFYRLAVLPITVPPLAERPADVAPLLRHFALDRRGQARVHFDTSAIASLERWRWPGNVRELANLVERAAILFPGSTINGETALLLLGQHPAAANSAEPELPLWRDTAPAEDATPSATDLLDEDGIDMPALLHDMERALILAAMTRCDQVVADAARLLGLRRTTLVQKLKRLGISRVQSVPD